MDVRFWSELSKILVQLTGHQPEQIVGDIVMRCSCHLDRKLLNGTAREYPEVKLPANLVVEDRRNLFSEVAQIPA